MPIRYALASSIFCYAACGGGGGAVKKPPTTTGTGGTTATTEAGGSGTGTGTGTGTGEMDPHAWLEDVTGEKQLAWVKEKNATSQSELE
ncbi:MAG: hypothetical protein F9K40_19090, partial [Kofleriaceae bacterium]